MTYSTKDMLCLTLLNTGITEYYRATIDSDSHLKRSVSFLNTFLVPANTAAYPSYRFVIETMQMTARSFGIQLLLLEIHPDDFRDAFTAIDKHGADALVVNADPDPYLNHAGLPTGPRTSLAHNLSHAGAGLRLEG